MLILRPPMAVRDDADSFGTQVFPVYIEAPRGLRSPMNREVVLCTYGFGRKLGDVSLWEPREGHAWEMLKVCGF